MPGPDRTSDADIAADAAAAVDSDTDARGRFCQWYPLADVDTRAPERPGVYQIKDTRRLRDYPRGKSAMLHYGHGRNLRAALSRDAIRHHPRASELSCRHQLVDAPEAAEQLYQTVLQRFITRFGHPPTPP